VGSIYFIRVRFQVLGIELPTTSAAHLVFDQCFPSKGGIFKLLMEPRNRFRQPAGRYDNPNPISHRLLKFQYRSRKLNNLVKTSNPYFLSVSAPFSPSCAGKDNYVFTFMEEGNVGEAKTRNLKPKFQSLSLAD
jgi:hypothetical protein